MARQPSTLETYDRKRDFARSPEPRGGKAAPASSGSLSFVVQKHDASHLHYDFRLELDGRLLSWAVPKGPCLDPKVKRMAVEVEDHPLSYGGFEGVIPAGNYGAGTVIVWDNGTWQPIGDPHAGLAKGDLKFDLHGHKLHGRWVLVRIRGRDRESAKGKQPWLLIKERDGEARPLDEFDVLVAQPGSVLASPGEPAGRRAKRPAAAAGSAARPDAAAPPDPPRAALPAKLAPQLATLASGPPAAEDDWLYELKYDGYRLLTRIDGRSVRCFTRNGHDWTDRMPQLVEALRTLNVRSGWIDGEIVVEDDNGAPDFQSLQNAFDSGATARIVYWIFDVPFLDGRDLRGMPFEQRSVLLPGLLGTDSPPQLRVSEAFDAAPRDLLAAAMRLGFEGIVGKRRDSHYVSARSPNWMKLKGGARQEFVIGGYTRPQGGRTDFGSLLLGVHDDEGRLQYCGNVGTGFDQQRLADIRARMDKLASRSSPFATPVPNTVKVQQFVRPELVAEVAFSGWTRDGHLRHPVFNGLRDDKPAREVRRERAADAEAGGKTGAARKSGAAAAKAGGSAKAIRVTHAERVIDSASGSTKGALVDYYGRVAPLMLPHLAGRPVSLVRAPEGVGGELFFQKHAQGRELPHVTLLDPALDPGHPGLLQIDRAEALLSVAQMNTIELHTWNATSRAIDRPDRMLFDLDPGEGVQWARVREGAQLVQALLAELGLVAFVKTSGGKGLHVVVPLRRHYGWDAVKGFSQAVVQHLAQHLPDRFVAVSGPRNRVGKIFVDYLRNGFGATTVAAWSVRARPGLGVSVPLDWSELGTLEAGDQWTLANVDARRGVGNAPWDAMAGTRNGLSTAMRRIGYVPPDA